MHLIFFSILAFIAGVASFNMIKNMVQPSRLLISFLACSVSISVYAVQNSECTTREYETIEQVLDPAEALEKHPQVIMNIGADGQETLARIEKFARLMPASPPIFKWPSLVTAQSREPPPIDI